MSFLDLYPQAQERAAKFQSYEGTSLPGFYEMHQSQIVFGLEAVGIIFIAVVVVISKGYLRRAGVTTLAFLIRMGRKIGSKGRLFWNDAEARAQDDPS